MKSYMIAAAVLIVAGIFGLAYGQFSYNKQSNAATLGPIELTITERETVNVPVWVGAGSIIGGVALMGYALVKNN